MCTPDKIWDHEPKILPMHLVSISMCRFHIKLNGIPMHQHFGHPNFIFSAIYSNPSI